MKLNFWQWLGVVLLIVAVVLIFRKRTGPSDVVTAPGAGAPTTAPAATTAP